MKHVVFVRVFADEVHAFAISFLIVNMTVCHMHSKAYHDVESREVVHEDNEMDQGMKESRISDR